MKLKVITFLVAFVVTGLGYGLLLYFFAKEFSVAEIIKQALFFGILWGLSEVFIFDWIRKRYKKRK